MGAGAGFVVSPSKAAARSPPVRRTSRARRPKRVVPSGITEPTAPAARFPVVDDALSVGETGSDGRAPLAIDWGFISEGGSIARDVPRLDSRSLMRSATSGSAAEAGFGAGAAAVFGSGAVDVLLPSMVEGTAGEELA